MSPISRKRVVNFVEWIKIPVVQLLELAAKAYKKLNVAREAACRNKADNICSFEVFGRSVREGFENISFFVADRRRWAHQTTE